MKKSFDGESSPNIAVTLHVLGSVYQERGNLQKAEEYLLKSLEMEKSFGGGSSPGIAATLYALGTVYYVRGDLQEAEKLFSQASEMFRLFYTDGHSTIVNAKQWLDNISVKLSDSDPRKENIHQLKD